jgi:glycosyltransferase involved in cell wall biosynthesis
MLPDITIVTAVKDGVSYFRETVTAVFAQDDPHWRWIIVDDGSLEPIQKTIPQLNDPRVTVIRLEESVRQTKALNLAINHSQTDIVARMDGDDIPSPTWIRSHREAWARQPEAWLIFSGYSFINEKGEHLGTVKYRPPGGDFFRYLAGKNNPVCHPTVSFRAKRSGQLIYQYSESVSNAQDYELWRRILKENGQASFLLIDESLVKYRIVADSLSGASHREQAFELESIRRNQPAGSRIEAAGREERGRMQCFRLLLSRYLAAEPTPLTGNDLRAATQAIRLGGKRALLTTFILTTWAVKPVGKKLLWGTIFR